jgi:hypothetical protein
MCCCGSLCSCCTLPSAEMLHVECSITDWERPAILTALRRLGSLYKQDFCFSQGKEEGRLWHWSKVGAGLALKFCEIVMWQVAGPLRVPCRSLAGHFGGSSRGGRRQTPQFGTPFRHLGEGGTSWLAILRGGAPPPPPPPAGGFLLMLLLFINL